MRDWIAGWDENNGGIWTYVTKEFKWFNLFEALQEAVRIAVLADHVFDFDTPKVNLYYIYIYIFMRNCV